MLGENAIKHGLAESLVERLHHHYNSNPQWISHLLINYRSHEAIMRLSSNLFYNSSVVSKSTAVLHPSTCYPLHFVCTSLTYGKFQNVIDIDMSEVDVVIKEVKKYTNPWPAQWGSREKSSVCIVASNRNQVCVGLIIYMHYKYVQGKIRSFKVELGIKKAMKQGKLLTPGIEMTNSLQVIKAYDTG